MAERAAFVRNVTAKRYQAKIDALTARIQALADRLAQEGHPTHDHPCPDDVRRELLAILDGQDAPGQLTVSLRDLDLVMNHAGDPTRIAEYPAAAQRIRDALEGGRRA